MGLNKGLSKMPTSSSFCELCGRQVNESPKSVIIDGTIFRVCSPCSKRGKPYNPGISKNIKPSAHSATSSPFRQTPTNQPIIKKRVYPNSRIQLTDETLLTHDFGRVIREARMKKGLTHEQLGLKMSEKASLLKKIETGALKPDELLARKFERYLQVKLYLTVEDEQE
jgi:putative transcription factor